MSEQVTIRRDKLGVPHIYGTTLRGMAYGFGYAQACDHLEPMLRSYMWGWGRLAEVDGRGGLLKPTKMHATSNSARLC